MDTQKKTSGSDTDTALTASQHKPIVSKDEQMDRDNGSNDSQKVPILVAVMLVVPIVSVLIILLGFKIYNSSKYHMECSFAGSVRVEVQRIIIGYYRYI